MNIDTILRLLTNSGFNVLGHDGVSIYLEDPSCILRSFETFIDYAWIIITFITGILLFGWAISYIRGAKTDGVFINLRNLVLIFGILTAVKPIVNVIWGDDLFATGCKTIKVSISDVNKILGARDNKLATRGENDFYEGFDIYDSGALAAAGVPAEMPYSELPAAAAGEPERIPVEVSGGIQPNPNTPNLTPSQPSRGTGGGNRPNAATESGKDVVYTKSDGGRYKRTGGTRAWKNNNPGNIRYSEFSKKAGAIGQAGNFAVFPDEQTGMNAITALLRSKSYNALTVGGAIARWAPPSENNTAGYQKTLEKLTGIPVGTPMNSLNDAQLSRVAGAIRQIEGWDPGREIQM